jgi:RNA recognition motif-containing protein
MDCTNVFVKFLPQDADDAYLRWLFFPFGTIVSAKVMVDQQTGHSLGYGYVLFYVCT